MGRNSSILNLLFPAVPFVLGLAVALTLGVPLTQQLALALGLCSASLLLLIGLKVPRWRQGKVLGFGPGQAPRGYGWVWWLALALFCCGLVFIIGAAVGRGT